MDSCRHGDREALPDQHLVQSQIRSNQVDCLFVGLQLISLSLCSMKATASIHHSLVNSVRHKTELMDTIDIKSIGAFYWT